MLIQHSSWWCLNNRCSSNALWILLDKHCLSISATWDITIHFLIFVELVCSPLLFSKVFFSDSGLHQLGFCSTCFFIVSSQHRSECSFLLDSAVVCAWWEVQSAHISLQQHLWICWTSEYHRILGIEQLTSGTLVADIECSHCRLSQTTRIGPCTQLTPSRSCSRKAAVVLLFLSSWTWLHPCVAITSLKPNLLLTWHRVWTLCKLRRLLSMRWCVMRKCSQLSDLSCSTLGYHFICCGLTVMGYVQVCWPKWSYQDFPSATCARIPAEEEKLPWPSW